jgi:hypothetical protein
MKFDIGRLIAYLSRKFKFVYSPRRIVGTLHEDLLKCMITSCCILLGMRNVWLKHFSFQVVKINENARFMFSIFFLRKSCYLCDKVEKYGTVTQATRGSIIRRIKKLRAFLPRQKHKHVLIMCNTFTLTLD